MRLLITDHATNVTQAVSFMCKVSPSWIRRLVQRRRESGEVAPRPSRNKRPAQWLAISDQIKQCIQEKPDLTLKELQQQLKTF